MENYLLKYLQTANRKLTVIDLHVAATRPMFELYELKNDPHELNKKLCCTNGGNGTTIIVRSP